MSEQILISEIFGPTVQGEGSLIGQPTVFVRTGGCDYRCHWCDTLYAVDPVNSQNWQKMTIDQILSQVSTLSEGKIRMITLSGGNPALQPLGGLIETGHAKGYQFALETQGSISKNWFQDLDVLTLSPKGPSAGTVTEINQIADCLKAAGDLDKCSIKIVIFEDADYHYAKKLAEAFPEVKLFLQVGNPDVDQDSGVDIEGLLQKQVALSERVIHDRWDGVRVLPQMHVLMWGNQAGV